MKSIRNSGFFRKRARLLRRMLPAAAVLAAGLTWSAQTAAGGSVPDSLVEERVEAGAAEETARENASSEEADASAAGELRPAPEPEGLPETPAAQTEAKTEDPVPETSAPELLVFVCGEVVTPYTYALPDGSRIADAVEAAGGFTERASRTALNLAERVFDGEMIRVPSEEEAKEAGLSLQAPYHSGNPAETGSAGSSGGENAASGKGALSGGSSTGAASAAGAEEGGTETGSAAVNINTADSALLCTLPGIGEKKAEKIIAYREEHGSFRVPEDIMNVPGIKEKAFSRMKDRIRVD